MTYKYIVTFLFLCSVEIGLSKELKIIDMEGTYDLDGDGQYEFAALEYNRLNGHTISMIRYYEIDIDGYQNLSWELEMPDGLLGSFIGVKLADIIGDGTPELVAVANLSSNGDETILQPIIFYYKWYDDGCAENPAGYLNIGNQNDFVRCHNFDLINGLYKQGGFVRFAIFLGNYRVVLDRKTDPIMPYVEAYDDVNQPEKKLLDKLKKGKGKKE